MGTGRTPNKEAATDILITGAEGHAAGWQFVVLSKSGAAVHRLPSSGTVTIGRSEEAGIRIDDGSVSRQHAVLHLGPPLELEDLGSANGTRIGERAVQSGRRIELRAGMFVYIGRAMAVVQPLGADASDASDATDNGPVVIADASMRRLHHLANRVAQGDISVLLLGETGVGKEVFAESIHNASPRRAKPLLRLNCSSLSETLLESELFGHERGSFTGANQARAGLFENADGGTIFLDEIGELPLGLQARLLRVIEDRRVRRVGAASERSVDVRFIAATNRDLTTEVNAGRFRRDLFYRLSAATLVIPPLRERPSEIVPLAKRFLGEEMARLARGAGAFSGDAIAWLQRHDWPGNIRELRNAIQRAVLLTSDAIISADHLRGADIAALGGGSSIGIIRTDSTPPPPPSVASASREGNDTTGLRSAVDAAERAQIVAALEATRGNQTAAAKRLGIGRRTLIDKMIRLGIERGRRA